MTKSQLGIFCGTFNPIHLGHLLIAEFARDQFNLEKVLFIPNSTPPHKDKDILAKEARYELVKAAIADNAHFEASPIEMQREGPSYTVDTLTQLQAEHPNAELNLIVGQDNLSYLPEWHDSARLFTLCRILVAFRAPRSDQERFNENFVPPGANVDIITFPDFPVSASAIRERLREGKTVLYMVPPAVNKILLANKHYVR